MSEVIDTTQALEQAAGNEKLAKELFGMLLNELPELEQKLGQAISDNDLQACWDHAHKIHGSTAYCGVPELRSAAQGMEQSIKLQDSEQIEENFAALKNAIRRLLDIGSSQLERPWA